MQDRDLFKGRRVDNEEWIIGNLVFSEDSEDGCETIIIPTVESNMFIKGESRGDLGFENWYKVDKDTICRCTGSKDKNGKLVWENDIAKDEAGNLFKVFWQENYYQFSWICVKSEKLPIGAKWNLWNFKRSEIEVIGNIFDNKELLEREE